MKVQGYDKNGIKILVPQRLGVKKHVRECWKVIYVSQEIAEKKASAAHDLRGDYKAYKCPRYNHWHIAHKISRNQYEQENQ